MTQNQKFDFNALSTNQKGVLGAALGMLIGLLLPFVDDEKISLSVWDIFTGNVGGEEGAMVLLIMTFFSYAAFAFMGTIAFAVLTYLNQFKNGNHSLLARISSLVVFLHVFVFIWSIGLMTGANDKSLTSALGLGAYLLLASSAAGIYFSRKD